MGDALDRFAETSRPRLFFLTFALSQLGFAIWNAAAGKVGAALVQLFFFTLAAIAARYLRRLQCSSHPTTSS